MSPFELPKARIGRLPMCSWILTGLAAESLKTVRFGWRKNPGVAEENVVEFHRRNIYAAPDDQVLEPARDGDEPVLVHHRNVAKMNALAAEAHCGPPSVTSPSTPGGHRLPSSSVIRNSWCLAGGPTVPIR